MDVTIALPVKAPRQNNTRGLPSIPAGLFHAALCGIVAGHSRHRAPLERPLCYRPRSLRKRIIGLNVLSTACLPAQRHSVYTSGN